MEAPVYSQRSACASPWSFSFWCKALRVAIGLNDGVEQASWALLPAAVGLAQIIFYFLAVPGHQTPARQDAAVSDPASRSS